MIKKLKFMQNLTRRMMVIWAISFAAFIVIGFGAVSLTMMAIPKTYGASIDMNHIFTIRYMNDSTENFKHGKPLIKREETHNAAMKDILRLLSNGSKTNAFANVFRGNPKQVVENNTTNTVFTSTFESTYAKNALIIEFGKPQHSIEPTSRTTYKIMKEGQGERDIHAIMIPLDNAGNRFQAQTWYLITQNRFTTSAGTSLSIANKISTYGNYYKLWDYINDLRIMP